MKNFVLILFFFLAGHIVLSQEYLPVGTKDTTLSVIDSVQKHKLIVRFISNRYKKRIPFRATIWKTFYDSTGRLVFKEKKKHKYSLRYSKSAPKTLYMKQTKYLPDGSYKVSLYKRNRDWYVVKWYDKSGKKMKRKKFHQGIDNSDNDRWEQDLPYTYWYFENIWDSRIDP